MPTATFLSQGDRIDYTPDSDVAAGDVVVINKLIGIATSPIPAGTLGSLQVRGIVLIPIDDPNQQAGTDVYWDGGQGVANAGGGDFIGKLLAPVANSTDPGPVLLCPGESVPVAE